MKKIKLILLFFLVFIAKGISQNDCVDAIVICGDANLSGLETVGIGTQEINPSNACSSQENNSIWLKIRIKTGGTFGFVLTPESSALVVDFDFWIYGPNATCNNLGTAIRCSTTNPLNAALTYNTTGMNATETDVSEGPGADGDAFIHWMTVNNNDVYYIAVDRPVGESNFSIAWTGSATFYEVPVAEPVNALQQCPVDSLPSGVGIFDLTPNAANAIGNQTGVTALFYADYSDAIAGINPIINTTTFQNTSNPQTVYVRVVNNVTGCYVITDFNLSVEENTVPKIEFSYATPVCLKGVNPVPVKVFGFSEGGVFTAVPPGLSINPQTGYVNLLESRAGQYTITYSVSGTNSSCLSADSKTFALEVDNCEIPRGISPNGDGKNDFFDISKFAVRELSIFNRYGVKVYHRMNYKNEWDGTTDKGKELPDSTYFYVIQLNNGESKTGWVYVIRERD